MSARSRVLAPAIALLMVLPAFVSADPTWAPSRSLSPAEAAGPTMSKARDLTLFAASKPQTAAGALELARAAVASRYPMAGLEEPGWTAVGSVTHKLDPLRDALEMAGSIEAAIGGRTNFTPSEVLDVALAASEAQAVRMKATGGPRPTIVPHVTPSSAVLAILALHNTQPTTQQSAEILELDTIGEPGRSALTEFLDAFLTLDATGRQLQETVPNLEWQYQDYGTTIEARNRFLEMSFRAIDALGRTVEDTYVGKRVIVPGILAIDFTEFSNTYTLDYVLIVDYYGSETYLNNAGASAGLPTKPVAAVVDFSGDDRYQRAAGVANGAALGGGIGFLLDMGGSDVYGVEGSYPQAPRNGGASGLGLGFLLDVEGWDRYHGGSFGANGGGSGGAGFLMDGGGWVDQYHGGSQGVNGGADQAMGFGTLVTVGAGLENVFAAGGQGVNGGGYYGHGFLYNQGGRSTYTATGLGANGGAYDGSGFLFDGDGTDVYTGGDIASNGGAAEDGVGMLVDATGGRVAQDLYTTGSQGVNGGAVAGGVGFLIDQGGPDHYVATALATNGGARDAGLGMLWDVEGDDRYDATWSGVNGGTDSVNCAYDDGTWCISDPLASGLLLDGGGSDTYVDGQDGSGVDRTVYPKGRTGAQIDSAFVEQVALGDPPEESIVFHLRTPVKPAVDEVAPVILWVLALQNVEGLSFTLTSPADLLLTDLPALEPGGMLAGEIRAFRFNATPQSEGEHRLVATARGTVGLQPFEREAGLSFLLGNTAHYSTNLTTGSSAAAESSAFHALPGYKLVRETPVVLVRGFNPPFLIHPGGDLENDYFREVIPNFHAWGWGTDEGDVIPIGLYNCDSAREMSQHHGLRGGVNRDGAQVGDPHGRHFGKEQLTGAGRTYGGNHDHDSRTNEREGECLEHEGHSRDTSIAHLAYHLAWTIFDKYHRPGSLYPSLPGPTCVKVLAHSMGGLVIRYALHQVEEQHEDFPKVLCITDVVTLATPHNGYAWELENPSCAAIQIQQCREMRPGSRFLDDLAGRQHPNGTTLAGAPMSTRWTAMASEADATITGPRALDNIEADLEVMYPGAAGVTHTHEGGTGFLAHDERREQPAATVTWQENGLSHGTDGAPWPVRWSDFALAHGPWGCGLDRSDSWPIPLWNTTSGEVYPFATEFCHYRAWVPPGSTRVILEETTSTGADRDLAVWSVAGSFWNECGATSAPSERCVLPHVGQSGYLNWDNEVLFRVDNRKNLGDEARDRFTVRARSFAESDCRTAGDAADWRGGGLRLTLPLESASPCRGAFPVLLPPPLREDAAGAGDREDWYRITTMPAQPFRLGVVTTAPMSVCQAFGSNPEFCAATQAGVLHRIDIGIPGEWGFVVRGAADSGHGYELFSAPDVPRNLRVTSTGDRSVALAWDAPQKDGARPLQSYTVYRGPPGGTLAAVQTTSSTSWTDTGVSNGVTYEYRVVARNDIGEGPRTTGVTGKPSKVPEMPGISTARGNGWISASWTPPTGNPGDGGEPITSYKIYRGVSGQAKTLAHTASAPPASGSWTDPSVGFVPGTSYCYEASAVNMRGEGPRSAQSCQVFAVAPNAPIVTSTTVQSFPSATSNLLRNWGFETMGTSPSAKPPFWDYVSAGNDCRYEWEIDQSSEASPAAGFRVEDKRTTVACGVWQEVSGISAGQRYFAQAMFELRTSAPTFGIEWYSVTGAFLGRNVVTVDNAPSWYAGYSVAGVGATAPSGAARARVGAWTTTTDRPEFVMDNAWLVQGGGSVARVDWSQSGNGGAPPDQYKLYRGPLAEATAWIRDLPASPLWATDDGLARGKTYHYRVAARNPVGLSPESDARSVTVPDVALPAPPSALAAQYSEQLRRVTLTWQPSPGGGDLPVVKYRVYSDCEAGGCQTFQDLNGADANGLSFVDPTQIERGHKIEYKVKAVTEAGESAMISTVIVAGSFNDCNLGADASDSASSPSSISYPRSTCTAKMSNEDDEDHYRFTVSAGQRIRAIVDPIAAIEMGISLYRPDGSRMAWKDSASDGAAVEVDVIADQTGSWRLFAYPNENSLRDASYTLEVRSS